MALYEFQCESCNRKFEQITSASDPEQGRCPHCHEKRSRRLISRFAVGGQGDLRETTQHGCHDCTVAPAGERSGDGHSHSHSDSHGDGHGSHDGHEH